MSALDNFSSSLTGSWSYTIVNFPIAWGLGKTNNSINVVSSFSYSQSGKYNLKKYGIVNIFDRNFLGYQLDKGDSMDEFPSIYIYKNSSHLVTNDKEKFKIKTSSNGDIFPKFSELKRDGYPVCIFVNNFYFKVYIEVEQEVYWANAISKTSPTKVIYKPYEPIDLSGLSIILEEKNQKVSSLEQGTIVTHATHTCNSWNSATSISSGYIGIPTKGYYTEKDIGTQTISITVQYTTFNWNLLVTDFDSDYYELKRNPNTNYSVYAGIEVGNAFLNAFNITRVRKNEFKTIETIVYSTLEKEKMSKTILHNSDKNFVFQYLVTSEKSITFSINDRLHYYSSINITCSKSYNIGTTLNAENIDIIGSGSIIYDDYVRITLNNFKFIENPNATYSIGNIMITEETPANFTLDFVLPMEHFGTLTHSINCNVIEKDEEYIYGVELVNTKNTFKYGEVISLGEDAVIKAYNFNGDLVKTISIDELTYIDDRYGKLVNEENNLLTDEPIILKLKYNEFELNHTISILYAKDLVLDTSLVKQYLYVGETFVDFDYSGIKGTITYNNQEIDVSDDLMFGHEQIDISIDSKVYVIDAFVSYENRILVSQFQIQVERERVISISASGESNSLNYFDSEGQTFKEPTDLNFRFIYNSGKKAPADISSIVFYKEKECLTLASQGYISKDGGNKIYFIHKDYPEIIGSYNIYFIKDDIVSVELINNPVITLGNRLNQIRDSFIIKATYESGNTDENYINYRFTNEEYIMAEESIKIIVADKEYVLDSNKITFHKPNIESITLNLNGFSTTYNNGIDMIDVTGITVDVKYEGATYLHTADTYVKTGATSSKEFCVTSSELNNYNFNGDETINITMDDQNVRKDISLEFKVINIFDNTNVVNNTYLLEIGVIEITEITGISLARVYREYKIGQKFLDDFDNTLLTLYYKDSAGNNKKIQVPLRSGVGALNISPMKGTSFYQIDREKTVRITSAHNSNVSVEYSISVNADYEYTGLNKRNLRVIKVKNYVTSNGIKLIDKYLIVDDEETIVENGVRRLMNNLNINDIKVYGYLDDINDNNKQARVILFDDYIPPIDGESNITIKYPCYVKGNADYINNCHFGHLFGNNNAKNRLFLSGNPTLPNCDWHSGGINSSKIDGEKINENGDFTYFEDTSYCFYGQTDNKVIGYDIVSNDKMVVLKSHSVKEPTIYYRTNGLIQAIDGSGNKQVGLNQEALYEESYPLVTGNIGAGAISNKSIINFNGDTLFISSDKQIDGLDVVGIIGDSQRYAYSRSDYINPLLKKEDLNKAHFFTNNKYLYLIFDDYILVTHFEKYNSGTKQYEWWKLDIKNVSAMFEMNEKIYFGTYAGKLFLLENNQYRDITKQFIGIGGSTLASEGEKDNTVQVSNSVIQTLKQENDYFFKIKPVENDPASYMYYEIAQMNNVKTGNTELYIDAENNWIEVIGLTNSEKDYDKIENISNKISDTKTFYLNHLRNENEIISDNISLKTYYRKYRLKLVEDTPYDRGECFKLIDVETSEEVDIRQLYRASLCERLDSEYLITDIDYDNCTFKLENRGEILNLVRYASQDISRNFRAEIKEYSNVKAYYITAPFTMGNLMYNKTIWGWTLTNDTDISSSLEVCQAMNNVDFDEMTKLSDINLITRGYNFNNINFENLDFDKYIVPHKYTFYRPLNVPFICFGFRNTEGTNAVLSTMQIIYTVPNGSVGRG